MDLKDKKVTVVGMGLTGVATANFLVGQGAWVTIVDQKKREQLGDALRSLDTAASPQFETSKPPGHAELIVLSPGVDIQSPFLDEARGQGSEIVSEIELASRFNRAPIIAVTGTNGKTTTVTLIANLLKEAGRDVRVGGNIGVPFISLIGREVPDFIALEVSSFQLEGVSRFRPHISLALNITPDHLDRHKTMECYAALKMKISQNQTSADFLILNADDPAILHLCRNIAVKKFFFSAQKEIEEGAYLRNGIVRVRTGGKDHEICEVGQLCQVLQWQVENVLAAATAGILAGIDAETIAKSIRQFSGLEHRLEWVRTLRGVDFINDSKSTNIGAAQKSLKNLGRPIIWIAGGLDKGGNFSDLYSLVKTKVKCLFLLGEAKPKIKEILNGTTPFDEVETLEAAVNLAAAKASPGDVVLLSPACASFDMFRDYVDRGNQFKDLVHRLS